MRNRSRNRKVSVRSAKKNSSQRMQPLTTAIRQARYELLCICLAMGPREEYFNGLVPALAVMIPSCF